MQTYPTGYAESHHIAEQIFREILPRHGMAVREEQIALCHEVLDTLYNKEISLCEAGVGTGKTLAYLVGCILWQMNRPERMKLPIVISTSSVALKDRIGLRSMLDAVENGRIEAVMVRDLEQISRNSYILVGVIEALRQNDVYLITTECDLNAELINSGVERFVGDRFTRASFGKPRFDVRLPLMEQF